VRKLAASFLLASVAFVACALPDDRTATVTASFEDIGDLAPSAPVMLADVQVGKVTDIELEGGRALVTMDVDRKARVPTGVIARVRRTSLLGERIVDLVVPEGTPADAPTLGDGHRIVETESRSDLEDLVDEGNQVLGPIAAGEVATLVHEGAKGFGNRGEELRTLLGNFQAIVHAYAGKTDEIRGVIDSLNEFTGTLASQADSHGLATANSARGLRMLREESGRLTSAIRSLARLSVGARSLLDEHADEMGRFFAQMRVILGTLREEQDSIVQLLRWAPGHNRNTQITEYGDFVQVLQDFVICGLNDDPSDPARTCEGGAHQ
jgi:phospholipid/cholesterol/gamma-HCH transport system substrate-binding protein